MVIDTGVLVYAVGGDHPLAAPAQALMEAIRARRVRATTTVEVLQEFAHIRAKRRPRRDAVVLAEAFADALSPLLSTDEGDLARGLRLFEETRLGAFDAVLAGTVIGREADGLVSADAVFAEVADLRWLPLDSSELARLLGG